jgi:hypothetical protein
MLRDIAVLATNSLAVFISIFFIVILWYIGLPVFIAIMCFNGWYSWQIYKYNSTKSAVLYLTIILVIVILSASFGYWFWYWYVRPVVVC